MLVVSKEHEQNKSMIQKIDQSIGLCALKHEIVEYTNELRSYCKQYKFDEHAERAEEFFVEFKHEMTQLN